TGIVAVTDPDYSETAALSRDGTRLVYIVRTNATSLEIISWNLDGTAKRTLARMTDILSHPAWSPDGTRIAFAPGPDFTIKTVPAEGGTVIPLTRHSSHCGDDWPMWSSDGRRIAFLRACAPNPADVFVMNADGSNQMNLTGGSVKGVFGGSWSPDGTRIAFVVAVKPGGPAVRFGRFQISIIGADGSGYRQLTRNGDNTSPTWSPDGKFIAFTSNRDGRYHVYTMMADGTNQSSLTPDPETEDFVLSWLPASVDLSAPSPAQNPSASPEATASPTPAWPLPKCATSWVNGDFDGHGQLDTAPICRLKGGTFSLNVQWASGAAGAVSLPDCQSVCEARGAGDLNGDGKDEFFLVISAGASTE